MSALFDEIREKTESYKVVLQQNLSRFDGLIEQESEKLFMRKNKLAS